MAKSNLVKLALTLQPLDLIKKDQDHCTSVHLNYPTSILWAVFIRQMGPQGDRILTRIYRKLPYDLWHWHLKKKLDSRSLHTPFSSESLYKVKSGWIWTREKKMFWKGFFTGICYDLTFNLEIWFKVTVYICLQSFILVKSKHD